MKAYSSLPFLLEECTMVSAFAVHFLMENLLPASGRVICSVHMVDMT
jgi:hypothetical protein